MASENPDVEANSASLKQTASCTPAREAVCKSIGDGPLGWSRRRGLRRQLNSEKEACGISAAFDILLTQAILYADKHRRTSLRWGRLHYILGVPATILATVSGALFTNSSQIAPAVLAFTAGGLSAAVAFLRCENSRDRNSALCAGWTELADQVRLVLLKYDHDVRSGDEPDVDDYSYRLICLNKCKMELLWGALRAGPERTGALQARPEDRPSGHSLAIVPSLGSNGSDSQTSKSSTAV
jgi:hypothetical protein